MTANAEHIGLDKVSDVSLICRDLRHALDWQNDYEVQRHDGKPIVIVRVAVCIRCETERWDTLAVPSFNLSSRKYVYPTGYLVKGTPRVRVNEVRAEFFTRNFGDVGKLVTSNRRTLKGKIR